MRRALVGNFVPGAKPVDPRARFLAERKETDALPAGGVTNGLRLLPDALDGAASTRALHNAMKDVGPGSPAYGKGSPADTIGKMHGIGSASKRTDLARLSGPVSAADISKVTGGVIGTDLKRSLALGAGADFRRSLDAASGAGFKRTLGLASGSDLAKTLKVFTEPSSVSKMLRAVEGPAVGKYPLDTVDRVAKMTKLSDRMLGAAEGMARKAERWERAPMLSAGPDLAELGRIASEQVRVREAKRAQDAAEGRAMLQRVVDAAEEMRADLAESRSAQHRAEEVARASEAREVVAEAKRAKEREAERLRADAAEARRIEERDADRRRSMRIAVAGAAMTIISIGSGVVLHFVG